MSKKQVRTKLKGHRGPFFPKIIDDLNKVYDEVGATGQTLQEIANKIWPPKDVKKDRPTTEDHYDWFWSLTFELTTGSIVVLFPWSQDWDKQDGVQMDRSIAVYTTGRMNECEVISMIETLRNEFLS